MKRLALFLVLATCLCSCSGKGTQRLVCFVSDEISITDEQTAKQSWEAIKAAGNSRGFKAESVLGKTPKDNEQSFLKALASNPALLISAGEGTETALVLSSQYNPRVYYVLIDAPGDLDLDGRQDSSNIFSVMFAHEEVGFLAGMAAALAERGGGAAYVADYEYVRYIEYECGFAYGVRSIDPSMPVSTLYIRPETPQQTISDNFDALQAKGVTVIFTTSSNAYIHECAKSRGMTLIAAPHDNGTNADMLVAKDYGKAINLVIDEFQVGTFKGQIRTYTVADGAIAYKLANQAMLSKASQNVLSDAYANLAQGGFKIPKTREELGGN